MRGAPRGVLGHHLEDQLANFFRYLSSSDGLLGFGKQHPVQTEPGPMPADRSFGCDDDERSLPSGPDPTNGDPEEFVKEI